MVQRHYDLDVADVEAVVACFRTEAAPRGWAGRIPIKQYASVWQAWLEGNQLPPSYGREVLRHLDRAISERLIIKSSM